MCVLVSDSNERCRRNLESYYINSNPFMTGIIIDIILNLKCYPNASVENNETHVWFIAKINLVSRLGNWIKSICHTTAKCMSRVSNCDSYSYKEPRPMLHCSCSANYKAGQD